MIKIFQILLITLVSTSVSLSQYYPVGGYQGGAYGSGGDQTLDVVVIDFKAFLQGAFDSVKNTTALNSEGYLPLSQPYDADPTAYWYYTGVENVDSIPHDTISDWILIELRETGGGPGDANADSAIARRAGFVLSNGKITDLDGQSEVRFKYLVVSKNLYGVILHRNHLPAMSASALALANQIYAYDYTDNMTKAYNNPSVANDPMALLPNSVYGLWGGEIFPDGIVVYHDPSLVYIEDRLEILVSLPEFAEIISGYYIADVNFDGKVRYTGENSDRLLIWKNTATGIGYDFIFSNLP